MDNQDLFTYLYETFIQSLEETVTEFSMADDAAIKKFCEFSKNHLETNTPIHMGFEDTGMGFQLQDGTHLVFVEQRSHEEQAEGAAVPVTMSSTATRGMSSMKAADDSVAVTEGKGNDEK